MLTEDIVTGAIVAGVIGIFLWLASRERKQETDPVTRAVLEGEDHKVKGRFD